MAQFPTRQLTQSPHAGDVFCFGGCPSLASWPAIDSGKRAFEQEGSVAHRWQLEPHCDGQRDYSHIGILISHYKDPYEPISIMECHMGF